MSRIFFITVLIATMFSGGCAVIAWPFGQFAPAKKIKAMYELPKDKRICVLVENRTYGGSLESVKRNLTSYLNAELQKHSLAREVVSYDNLIDFRLSTPNYNSMSVAEIGQKFNANMVLYVHIDKFTLKDNLSDTLWHGQCKATVKVIKVAPGITRYKARLWPKDRLDGYPVKPVDRDVVANSSPNYGAQLAQKLSMQMADHIAKVFYDHRLSGIDGREGRVTDDREKILQ